jgi:hypothetical protein
MTLDTPATPAAFELFRLLDRIAIYYRAPVNLAKDSRLGSATVDALFPEYDAFWDAVEKFDPNQRFASALRRRLGP